MLYLNLTVYAQLTKITIEIFSVRKELEKLLELIALPNFCFMLLPAIEKSIGFSAKNGAYIQLDNSKVVDSSIDYLVGKFFFELDFVNFWGDYLKIIGFSTVCVLLLILPSINLLQKQHLATAIIE